MTSYEFETPRPVDLYVENGSGSVTVTADETAATTVRISGRRADEAVVRQSGDQVSVVAPKGRSGLLGDSKLDIEVAVPSGSGLVTRTGSADLVARGSYRSGQLRSGSGDISVEILDGPALVETGSGDVRVDTAERELRIKSGSGDVSISFSGAALAVSTGSGDVEIGTSTGPTVVKTGSGDLSVTESRDDVAMSTGSGDFVVRSALRGRLSAKGASGDVQVGIPAGVPVWTDISTVSGRISSQLNGVGEPEEGADHVEVRCTTVSGDITLTEA